MPICPQHPGEFYIKVLIKLEEESKYREMEIRRFIIKLNVMPSVKFNLSEEILFYDSNSTHFNLNVNAYIENRSSLSSLKIENIYYHDRYSVNKEYDWKLLENENYTKLYTVLKMKKNKFLSHNSVVSRSLSSNFLKEGSNINIDKIRTLTRSTSNGFIEKVTSCDSNSYSSEKSSDFKFLPEFASDSNILYIIEKFNHLLQKDKILFHFSVRDNSLQDNDRLVNGLFIYDNIIKIPQINKNFLKTIFVNSIEVSFSHVMNYAEMEQNMVIVNLILDKKGLAEISDISAYEIYVNDEEFDYNWIGCTRYKILNKKSENIFDEMKECLNFCFLTNKKGIIEMNKICVSIIPKNLNEKPFVLSNVLRSKTIELLDSI